MRAGRPAIGGSGGSLPRANTAVGPRAYDDSMAAPSVVSPPSAEQVTAALAGVNDPEIRRPITELGMVKGVEVAPDGKVGVGIYLTVATCPLRDTITADVTAAVSRVPGVTGVDVRLDVMSGEQR